MVASAFFPFFFFLRLLSELSFFQSGSNKLLSSPLAFGAAVSIVTLILGALVLFAFSPHVSF
jgi:hypothetical protein